MCHIVIRHVIIMQLLDTCTSHKPEKPSCANLSFVRFISIAACFFSEFELCLNKTYSYYITFTDVDSVLLTYKRLQRRKHTLLFKNVQSFLFSKNYLYKEISHPVWSGSARAQWYRIGRNFRVKLAFWTKKTSVIHFS